LIKLFQIC